MKDRTLFGLIAGSLAACALTFGLYKTDDRFARFMQEETTSNYYRDSMLYVRRQEYSCTAQVTVEVDNDHADWFNYATVLRGDEYEHISFDNLEPIHTQQQTGLEYHFDIDLHGSYGSITVRTDSQRRGTAFNTILRQDLVEVGVPEFCRRQD